MAYDSRVELYQRIETVRGHPLITYVTSLRQNGGGQMASDVIPEFARQILAIPAQEEHVDILMVSTGGDPIAAWRIVSMLRERFKTVSMLLPYTAYSAATLLALGADKIVMHPFSHLGPVDPQIVTNHQREGQRPDAGHFGSEDLVHYLGFVREDVGITDQAELQKAFELLCKDVGSLRIGVAKRSAQLSLSLGERLLCLHMQDHNEARTIAESLTKSFYHHGYTVGRTEAKQIGLPVEEPEEDIEKLLWQVWQDLEDEMECNNPFSPNTRE